MKRKNPLPTGTLRMAVRDDNGFLSPFYPEGEPVISGEVADFLENVALAYPPGTPLALHISGDCVEEAEQDLYRDAIRNHYLRRAADAQRESRRKTVISLLFTLIGVLALGGMAACAALQLKEVWMECIDIFGWVFLWEAVDQFFLARWELRMHHRRYLALAQMPVSYSPAPTPVQKG